MWVWNLVPACGT